ncbi:sulfotransferase family protein [Cryomorphaceae bacterium 1068]|nr:sulfotransferase family protein [Cryomorphaceae bacterium 1068]
MADNTTRICLWSGPRNVSTALMYSFAQRSDCRVFDEPLYAHYLSHTDAHEYHPRSDEILSTMENDGEKVVEMMMGSHKKPVAFFKHMTHHLFDLKLDFLKDCVNVILTRDPREMLVSFDKVIPNPSMQDVGYEAHLMLMDHLERIGQKAIVLDSKEILLDPKTALTKFCDTIGISFQDGMLSWKVGPIPEDGIWAEYWYGNVHKSTGFRPYFEKEIDFPERLEPLLEKCQKIYQELVNRN